MSLKRDKLSDNDWAIELQEHYIIYSLHTHQTPLRNLKMSSVQNELAKLEIMEKTNPRNCVGKMTVFLPLVSAKNPQKCELTMIPTNPIALRTPLSQVSQPRSHCETGRT